MTKPHTLTELGPYESVPLGTPHHLEALLSQYIQNHSVWREGARDMRTDTAIPEAERARNREWMDWTLHDIERYEFGRTMFAAVLLENWPEFLRRRTFTLSHPSCLAAYLMLWAAVRDGTKPA